MRRSVCLYVLRIKKIQNIKKHVVTSPPYEMGRPFQEQVTSAAAFSFSRLLNMVLLSRNPTWSPQLLLCSL